MQKDKNIRKNVYVKTIHKIKQIHSIYLQVHFSIQIIIVLFRLSTFIVSFFAIIKRMS